MDKLYIIKIGGNIIDDETRLLAFVKNFASLPYKKILVHGGGRLATQLAGELNIPQQMVEGRRITDAATLRVVTMVYAGYVNKQIVALLQQNQCNAFGLSGADGNAIRAHKRTKANVDYGFAGDIDEINAQLFDGLLQGELSPVLAPITHDRHGQLLNTNADTIASELAKALGTGYQTELVYCFEQPGVLLDINNPHSVIKNMHAEEYAVLKKNGSVFAGMIPKLDNAFAALNQGVHKVIIGKAEDLPQLITAEKGTVIERG